MPLGLVVRPVPVHEYRVPLVLQEFATGQPIGIIPHLETTQGYVNAPDSTSYGLELTLGESLNPPQKSHTAR